MARCTRVLKVQFLLFEVVQHIRSLYGKGLCGM
jgi:hypothetical protein